MQKKAPIVIVDLSSDDEEGEGTVVKKDVLPVAKEAVGSKRIASSDLERRGLKQSRWEVGVSSEPAEAESTVEQGDDDGTDSDCQVVDKVNHSPNSAEKVAEVGKDASPEETSGSCKSKDEDDMVVLHEVGEVAARDWPHARSSCVRFPFIRTMHVEHCTLCHCWVCDVPAPCSKWGSGNLHTDHCHATDKDPVWKVLRDAAKCKSTEPDPPGTGRTVTPSASYIPPSLPLGLSRAASSQPPLNPAARTPVTVLHNDAPRAWPSDMSFVRAFVENNKESAVHRPMTSRLGEGLSLGNRTNAYRPQRTQPSTARPEPEGGLDHPWSATPNLTAPYSPFEPSDSTPSYRSGPCVAGPVASSSEYMCSCGACASCWWQARSRAWSASNRGPVEAAAWQQLGNSASPSWHWDNSNQLPQAGAHTNLGPVAQDTSPGYPQGQDLWTAARSSWAGGYTVTPTAPPSGVEQAPAGHWPADSLPIQPPVTSLQPVAQPLLHNTAEASVHHTSSDVHSSVGTGGHWYGGSGGNSYSGVHSWWASGSTDGQSWEVLSVESNPWAAWYGGSSQYNGQ